MANLQHLSIFVEQPRPVHQTMPWAAQDGPEGPFHAPPHNEIRQMGAYTESLV